jgi:hypothetical protein
MRVHRLPPATVAAFEVARLGLAKNFKDENLYLLLHLCYGCPGRRQMELILTSDNVKGVPANVTVPEFFRCPICEKEKTNSLPANAISDRTFLPIGARFGADFGFYNQTSIRGFTCFLLVTEHVTGYKWIFCRCSKHPPKISCYGSSSNYKFVLACHSLLLALMEEANFGAATIRNRLLKEVHCIVEPTGAYNSAANGLAERGIGVTCVQAQICLYASGLDVCYWCFALSHAAMLCNSRPQVDTGVSSHEALLKVLPNYANLAIWGSSVYVVNCRLIPRCP